MAVAAITGEYEELGLGDVVDFGLSCNLRANEWELDSILGNKFGIVTCVLVFEKSCGPTSSGVVATFLDPK